MDLADISTTFWAEFSYENKIGSVLLGPKIRTDLTFTSLSQLMFSISKLRSKSRFLRDSGFEIEDWKGQDFIMAYEGDIHKIFSLSLFLSFPFFSPYFNMSKNTLLIVNNRAGINVGTVQVSILPAYPLTPPPPAPFPPQPFPIHNCEGLGLCFTMKFKWTNNNATNSNFCFFRLIFLKISW